MFKNTSIRVSKLATLLSMALVLALVLMLILKPKVTSADDSVNVVFSNPAPITINTTGLPPNPAAPYPSTISVSGMTGTTTKVTVTLNGLSHTRPNDIDMLLVSPTGAKYVMFGDVSNFGGAAVNVTLTLDDAAAQALPSSSALASGTFRPSSYLGASDTFPAPAPGTPYVFAASDGTGTFASVFNGADPNGTWSLYVVDDATTNSGSLAGGWGLTVTTSGSSAMLFTNSGSIVINDVVTVTTPASPYPSTISVSGVTGVVTDLNVTLTGVSHTRPGDIDALLVSPNGLAMVLMSDVPVNNTSAITNLNFTFDNAASGFMPFAGPLASGTFQPTDHNTGTDVYPSPAPSGTFGSGLVTFNNVSPNGTWSLYIVDDSEGDAGSVSGGWSLDITTAPYVPPVLGCGSAIFSGPTSFATGSGPTGAAVGDFNNDTKQDLAVTNQSSNNVSVLLGDGIGGFGLATNFSAGTNPYSIGVGLFNNDANQDLVVVNAGSNNVSILLGDGLGGFLAPTNYGTGPSPISVAVGDLNNDTKPDLAVAEFGGFFAGTVSVLLNSGTGTFGPAVVLAARTQPSFVTIGEFNGDTNSDLAVANFGSNNVSIFLGNGTGTFTAAPAFSVGSGPVSIAVADFNADAKNDLAVANYNSDSISIRIGVGDGTFTSSGNQVAGANPISVKVGEFSNDIKPDLAVANRSSNNVSVLVGTGFGGFGIANNFDVGTAPSSVVVGEFNSDSRADLATANTGSGNASVLLSACAVAKGTRFDFTGDRRTDFAVYRPTNNTWYILFSEGGGFFDHFVFGTNTDILVPEDYDGDGKTDRAVFRPSTATWIVAGIYNVEFGLTGDLPVPSDYDGDGRADIAVFRPSDGTWYIRRSTDNMWMTIPFGTNGDKPIPRDFDGDNKSDVAVFRPSTGAWYVLRSSDSQVIGLQFGISTDRPVAADYDGDGKADIAVFRASDGAWYIMRSSDSAFVSYAWGLSTDIPTPGDYDGDGKFDVAIYRPSTGYWYVLRSSSGSLLAQPWGISVDIPIPSTNVP